MVMAIDPSAVNPVVLHGPPDAGSRRVVDTRTVDELRPRLLFDRDGRLRIRRAPISRAGVFRYLGRELPDAPKSMRNEAYAVFRPVEELRRTAKQFAGCPLTLGHDEAATVGAVVFPRYEGGFILGDLIIYDKAAIDSVLAGERSELSAGFAHSIDWQFGCAPDGQYYQAVQEIREPRHVALVPFGRCGPSCSIANAQPAPFVPERYS